MTMSGISKGGALCDVVRGVDVGCLGSRGAAGHGWGPVKRMLGSPVRYAAREIRGRTTHVIGAIHGQGRIRRVGGVPALRCVVTGGRSTLVRLMGFWSAPKYPGNSTRFRRHFQRVLVPHQHGAIHTRADRSRNGVLIAESASPGPVQQMTIRKCCEKPSRPAAAWLRDTNGTTPGKFSTSHSSARSGGRCHLSRLSHDFGDGRRSRYRGSAPITNRRGQSPCAHISLTQAACREAQGDQQCGRSLKRNSLARIVEPLWQVDRSISSFTLASVL